MTLYVIKNSRPDTLATVAEKPTGDPREVAMTEAEYIAWRDAQTVTDTPQVPASVPNYKLRLWLNSQGILAAVESKIQAASEEVKILWNERPDVRRDSALVATFGAALGLSEAQIDAAFIAANLLD